MNHHHDQGSTGVNFLIFSDTRDEQQVSMR